MIQMLRVFILFVAVASGGTAAWVTTNSAPEQVAVAVPEALPTAEVLVAAGPLEPGSVLRREDMRWQPWPLDGLTDGFVLREDRSDAPQEFVGKLTRGDLASGEPIRAERLIETRGGFLSALLDPGMRAVAVRISAESTAGGFIMPNDRVDVLRTISRPGPSGQSEIESEAILRDIRVLAIDQATDTGDSGAVLGKTATLELAVSEVEIVVAAEASGLLSLSLRSVADATGGPRIVDAPTPKPAIRIFRAGVMEQVYLQ